MNFAFRSSHNFEVKINVVNESIYEINESGTIKKLEGIDI